ncbi:hypothetical protein COCSUDRAFT_58576 [Coccomyxa subellipsoidea C-169]|uniref:Uncharacterized protein n=1 Tax=Coccomyxa subellipsoidea (strain C-169) TaxID=574566 RepID=I0YLK8_COCSC|nr:hypothetical protein COCSUDRAFT_58576 [Coccomyxa subellipsoidea C-169]EIE19277.1 hypothetical protein COCSUDRAFT_58576 [Coccomyxa subellipsoidea C-169]|eukprot:XP_005643821.1 hypothetical protein COCSUDRAFT_58576 [Coccomyxa subellipsoidea C-169]
MLSKDVPARRRDAELAARQNALVEAVATPECFVAFVRLFLGRLTTYHEGNRRALSYIRRAQVATEEASLHLGKKGGFDRGRVIEAAITELQTLEAVVTQEGGSEGIEEGELSEVDDLDLEDVRAIPPAYWAGRFFSGLIRYLRAAKGGLIRLRFHLAQPDSLGIALLAAASSQLLCAQFELDGRGSLEVFPDSAVISVFEYKSSQSGFPKGKRQLAARLQVLMWAVRVSGAVPSGVPITGRGHLYLPGYARLRPHDIQLDGGSMSISIASI